MEYFQFRRGQHFQVVDDEGNVCADLGMVNGEGVSLTIYGTQRSSGVVSMGVNSASGGPFVGLRSRDGEARVILTVSPDGSAIHLKKWGWH